MKRIFFYLLLILFSSEIMGQGTYAPPVGVPPSPITTYVTRTFSDTLTFDIGAQIMSIPHPSRNGLFTTITANNTINAGQAVVYWHGDTTHRIQVDTSAATGFHMIGFPDSLHDNFLIFQWFGAGQPLCTVTTNYNYPPATQVYYSDSMRNNANDVITVNNSAKDLDFGGNAPFTLGMWVKIYAGSAHTFFIRKESSNSPIIFDMNSAGYLRLAITDSLGHFAQQQATDLAIFSGGWHYVLATYNGNLDTSGITLWVDGVKSTAAKAKSGTLVTTYIGTSTVQFMDGASAGAYNFCQFFAANGVLTNTQIAEIYNSNNHLDVSNASFYGNVIAWYPWINQAWTDYSGNGHTLTATSHLFSTDFK